MVGEVIKVKTKILLKKASPRARMKARLDIGDFGIVSSWEKPGFTICSCRTTVRRLPKGFGALDCYPARAKV
jgi:hypothetical protein